MTTQTNTTLGGLSPRLEIASRVLAGLLAKHEGYKVDHFAASALGYADALLAADAESRKEEPQDDDLALERARAFSAIRAELAEATKECEQLRAQLAAAATTIEKKSDALLRASEQLLERGRQIEQLTESLDDARATAYGLREKLAAAEAEQLCAKLASANEELSQVETDLARVTAERDWLANQVCSDASAMQSLRDSLASALAPLPEEEGLEELSESNVRWCKGSVSAYDNIVARHALASNARVKARKAREEGRLA